MRTLSATDAILAGLSKRSTCLRVWIDRDGAGDWVNLADLDGYRWVTSIEYAANTDAPVGSCTVKLRREHDQVSLSPLMAASKLAASGIIAWPKREFYVEIGIVAQGTEPSTWLEVFRGRIDVIEWHETPMQFKGRDLGGDLQDGWIEAQAVYGATDGDPIEDVIQNILDVAYSNGWIPYAVTLYSETGSSGTPFVAGDSPGFLIRKYKQGRESVMDAIQKLVRLIGWECRYRWNSNDSAFRLTLFEPARAVRSRGTITVSGDPTAAETFDIDGNDYEAVASGAGTDEFNIATGDTEQTAQNIADMLNAGTGKGDLNAWRSGSTVIVEWQTAGAAGDTVVFDFSGMSNVSGDGGGTLGGTRAGVDATSLHTFGPSDYFDVDSLSIDVADVRNAFEGTFEGGAGTGTTTLSVGSTSTFTRAAGSFIDDGFVSGMTIQTAGFTDSANNGQFTVSTVAALTITITDAVLVAESGGGDESIRGQSNPVTVKRINSDSIDKYHRRPLIITKDATSQIDTVEEMIDLLDAADNDLSEPDLGQGVLLPYFPWGEPGDLYTFEANGIHYDSDQELAAVELRHVVSETQGRTMLRAAGKPGLGPSRWLEAEGRAGVASPPDIYQDAAADNVTASAAPGAVIVTYDDPQTMDPPILDWKTTVCHVSTSSGFDPTATTRVVSGRETRFVVPGLVPGTTYYVKLQIIDEANNVAATSTQVVKATEYVAPYHEDPNVERKLIIPNGNFDAFTKGDDSPPDKWGTGTNTWGATDDVYFSTTGTEIQTGKRSLKVMIDAGNTGTTISMDDFAPISAQSIYSHGIVFKPTDADNEVRHTVNYYTEADSLISVNVLIMTDLSVAWHNVVRQPKQPPSTARQFKVFVQVLRDAADFDCFIDRVTLRRVPEQLGKVLSGDQSYTASAFAVVDYDTDWSPIPQTGMSFDATAGVNEATIRYEGPYHVDAQVNFDKTAAGNSQPSLEIQVDTGSGFTTVVTRTRETPNVGDIDVSADLYLEEGDKVRVRFSAPDNGTLLTAGPNWFRITQDDRHFE